MSELPEYLIDRVFEAPRELVWRAWTDPDILHRWYGPGVQTTIHQFDLKPGGTWLHTWESLQLYTVADPERYAQRFEHFAAFYESFYGQAYSVDPDEQFRLFDYPDLGLTLVGLNSCHNNDPLNRVGCINAE